MWNETMYNMFAVSEIWLGTEKEADVELKGYELCTSNWENKYGGGVNTELKCKIVEKNVNNSRKYHGMCLYRNRYGENKEYNNKLYL